ncbi:hypothetical protein FRC12_013801, partial [Ceratobasidium sp. 428]
MPMDSKMEESSSPTVIDHPDSTSFQRRASSRSQQPGRTTESSQDLNPNSEAGKKPRLKAVGLLPIAIRRMMTPNKKIGQSPTYMSSLMAIVKASWLNVLLVFIPIGWALHFTMPHNYIAVFVTTFIAIIPLAKLLGFATEELALRVGQTI